ncbi:MAG TPA: PPC domain-containing protein, partial [Gemmataceae bacterium]
PRSAALDGFEYRIRNSVGSSNPVLITYAKAPVVIDNEANDMPDTAQEVPLPCEIAGRIEKIRDRDWYSLTLKKGEVYNIEVLGDRIGSPCDLKMKLRNPAAKQDIVELDDNPDTISPRFFSRTLDPPVYRFAAPADGKYQLLVTSQTADKMAGPREYYRVRVTPDMPDYQLVVMPPDNFRPDSCCLMQGASQNFTVFALRQDGWNGEVAITVEGLPMGVTCPPQTLGTGQRQTEIVLTASDAVPPWTGEIKVTGTATIKGQKVVREARAASITWPVQPQQNIPTISRLDRTIMLAVRDKAPYNLTATIDKPLLQQGDKATIAVKLARVWPDLKNQVTVLAIDLPPNLTINNNQPVNIAADKTDATLAVDVKANVLPGTYNLVLRTQTQFPYNKDPNNKQKQPVNVVLPATPVTITVLPKNVATVAVAVPNPNVKVGAETEVVVKVTRLFDFAGEFKVELVLPPNAQGVSAEPVTIPAGKDEAKLILKADAAAAPGARNDLVVKATGMIDKTVTTQEAKFNVTVVK